MKNSSKNKYKVGSLFAGIGGICSAFEQAGFEVAWANEYDKKACETYRANNNKVNLIEADIHSIDNPLKLGYVDIITSGFPCQAFSVAGYRQGFKDEKGRGNLFFETARFIDEIKPKAFLLENVKNLVSHDKGKTFEVIRKTIVDDLNYSFIPFVLNSKDYGNTPQTRERAYIVGFKDESNFVFNVNQSPKLDFLSLKNSKKNSKKDACSLLFKIPEPIRLTWTIRDLLEKKEQDYIYYYNAEHKYYPKLAEAMKNRHTVYQWRRKYVRENKSNLCPTLTANMGTGGHNVPLVIDDFGLRKLTPKECIRFQGFPESFKFPENMANSHCYKQAGNSVVVPVVKRIANEIKFALDAKDEQEYFMCNKVATA